MRDQGSTGALLMTSLLCDVSLARRLEISRRKVWSMNATGALPAPVRMGRSVRWRETDIARWLELGCPHRERFEALKGGGQ